MVSTPAGGVSAEAIALFVGFIFQAGVVYANIRQHGKFLAEIRDWKHNTVTPRLENHGLRIGIVEHSLGIDPPAPET